MPWTVAKKTTTHELFWKTCTAARGTSATQDGRVRVAMNTVRGERAAQLDVPTPDDVAYFEILGMLVFGDLLWDDSILGNKNFRRDPNTKFWGRIF